MSFASEILISNLRAAQVRRVLCEFWANCLETASLIRQGVTPPVLVVWALLLVMVAVQVLSSHQVLR